MRVSRCVVFAVLLVAFACTAACATEYFVATNGNDSSPGTIIQPFLTINKGTTVAVAGDTVSVRTGTYAERIHFYSDGAAGAEITVRAYDGDLTVQVTDGAYVHAQKYIKIVGLELSGSVNTLHVDPGADYQTQRSQYVTIQRCLIHPPTGGDVAKANQSDYVIFEDCEIYGPPGDELVDWVWVTYSTVRRSYLHDYTGYCFTAKGGSMYSTLDSCVLSHAYDGTSRMTRFGGSTNSSYQNPASTYGTEYSVYKNNIMRDTAGFACGTYECWYAYFYNNTIYNCGAFDQTIFNHHADNPKSGDGGSRHLFYYNNIVFDSAGDMPIVYKDQSGKPYEDWQHDYNNYWNNGNPIPSGGLFNPNLEANSTFGNPNLANPGGTATTYAGWLNCYRITAASTLLIDRGNNAAGNDPQPAVHYDIEGTARPQGAGWDIGAFEYSTGPIPPIANFTGNPTSGTAPLTVAFTDASVGSPTSWAWTFGDGGTATAQNPSHVYNSAGSYTVSLTATNAQGSDGETKTNYITAVQAQDYTCASLTVNTGTLKSGDHTSVHTSDNGYLVIGSAKVSNKQTAQVSYTMNTGLGSLSLLTVTVEGKVSAATQPLTVYAYNYTTATWTSIATGTLTTTDTTVTPSVSNPSQYISGGTVQVRVKAGGSASTAFDHSTDLVKITAAP